MVKGIWIFIALFFLFFNPDLLIGQNQNIDIRFLNAKFTDTTSGKNLVAVFLVGTPDSASFPPMVMLPPKCTVFENGREKVVLLGPEMLGLTLYGEDIPAKGKEIYELIKEQVDLKSLHTAMIVAYSINGINFGFNRMTLTPAFREKKDQTSRIEKRCEFTVR